MKKQIIPASKAGRKLSLGKKTISNLLPSEMANRNGGSNLTVCFPSFGCGGKTQNAKTCYGHKTCYYNC